MSFVGTFKRNRIAMIVRGAVRCQIAAVFITLCAPSIGQTSSFVPTIETMKRSLVAVACASMDEQRQIRLKEFVGSGFFINREGNFITAAHVIEPNFRWNEHGQLVSPCIPSIYVPSPDWLSAAGYKFDKCVIDRAIDLAICKTSLNPFRDTRNVISVVAFNQHILPDGTTVAFTGFPKYFTVPVTSVANIASYGKFDKNSPIPFIAVDKKCWHGMSGGPVYTVDGEVIGMVLKGAEADWDAMTLVRPAEFLLQALSDNKISATENKKAPNKKVN